METLFALIVSAVGFCGYFLIGENVLWKKKTDKYYRKRNTMRFFNAVFLYSAAEDIAMIFFYLDMMPGIVFQFILWIKVILVITTLIVYFSQRKTFSQTEIPEKVHQEKIKKFKNKIHQEIQENKKFSETTKADLCTVLNSI